MNDQLVYSICGALIAYILLICAVMLDRRSTFQKKQLMQGKSKCCKSAVMLDFDGKKYHARCSKCNHKLGVI